MSEKLYHADEVVSLAANVDDMTAEQIGTSMSRLMSAGALDVTAVPALMKSGRPGHRIEMLCTPEQEETMTQLMFQETTTLGVRRASVSRWTLARRSLMVETPLGPVSVKIAGDRQGRILRVKAERREIERLSESTGRPPLEVEAIIRQASEAALEHPKNR